MAFLTAAEIVREAMAKVPAEYSGASPEPLLAVQWFKAGLAEAQRLTGFYRRRKTVAFTTPWTSAALAVNDIQCLKLKEVWDGTSPREVVDYDVLQSYREALAGFTYAVFAVNPYPLDAAMGTATLEAYPGFTEDDTVEAVYEDCPAAPASLDATTLVEMPSHIMVWYIAWQQAISVQPERADYFEQKFYQACASLKAHGANRKRDETARLGGYLANQAATQERWSE